MKTNHFLSFLAIFAVSFTFFACSGDSSGETAKLCGNEEYDANTYRCESGELIGKCKGADFYPAYQICNNGVIEDVNSVPSSSSVAPPPSSSSLPSTSGTFTDIRDSKSYKWVKIGTQTWMAENLNYEASGSCYLIITSSICTLYGRLYDWATAKTVCPAGWHLPSDAEWDVLVNYVERDKGCSNCAGKYLKAANNWNGGGNGTDNYGFAALPGGYGYSDSRILLDFDGIGIFGSWWSTSGNAAAVYGLLMSYDDDGVSFENDDESFLESVRCLKD